MTPTPEGKREERTAAEACAYDRGFGDALTQAVEIVTKTKESCGSADEYYTDPRCKEVTFAKAMLSSARAGIESLKSSPAKGVGA